MNQDNLWDSWSSVTVLADTAYPEGVTVFLVMIALIAVMSSHWYANLVLGPGGLSRTWVVVPTGLLIVAGTVYEIHSGISPLTILISSIMQ